MIRDFDVNNKGNKLVYLESGVYNNELSFWNYNLKNNKKKMIIDEQIRPQGPRFSNYDKIAFFAHSKIYTYDCKTKEIYNVFAKDGLHAGFCELSTRNNLLSFSAHGQENPPTVYILDLDNRNLNAISPTDSGNRFPHWSYSGNYIAYTHQKLSDIEKLKWVCVYNIDSGKNYLIPKDKKSQGIINMKCWSPNTEELVYLERDNNKAQVKIFNVENKEVKYITEVNQVQEVSFLDSNHLVFISEDNLQLYSLSSNKVIGKAYMPSEQKILIRFDGAIIRISKNEIYFLTKSGNIYSWDFKNELKIILKSEVYEKPLLKIHKYKIKSFDDKEIPVYKFIPKNSNGFTCIFAIGGPGEEASSEDDPICMEFLKRGYELIIPAYRGCRENPDNFGELGQCDVKDIIEVGKYYKEKLQYKLPIIGYSYGGLLMFLALAKSEDVFSCGISLWGVTEFKKLSLHLKRIINEDMSENVKRRILDSCSAVKLSDKINVPCYIFHGDKDDTSTNDEVEQIKSNIEKNGVECNLVIYKNETHGLKRKTNDYFEKISDFLKNI